MFSGVETKTDVRNGAVNVIEEAVSRGVSLKNVGSAYPVRGGNEKGPPLSLAEEETVRDLVRMLSAVDESQVPEIHSLAAATLTRDRARRGRTGLA
ncbi:hypothetical protein BN2476_830044 [Paraburkholderia piptadeniae]|uniref:Uncharacterized protein n=1 Tax=Paraburkholderia piptadeniae TaxID=1701573 RepID=A0A1N7SSW6_9BURK|nr:hypothetical protein BN2476_830044 [Paraburkholderia piptadeniae]